MKRFLIKIFISSGLLFIFILGYGSFCDFFFQQKKYLDISEKKQWILAQEGGNWDYAVLGSSRAFGAFDMNLLDSLTGWNGINLGSNGSGFKDNYLVLSLFLKSNQIEKLFLQVDMASLNSKSSFSNEFHAFTFLPYWDDPEVRIVLQEEIPILNNSISSILPQWRYFYYNKYFSPKEVIRRVNLKPSVSDIFTDYKGGMKNADYTSSEIKTYVLPQKKDLEDWKYLWKIKSKAEEEGINLVLFSAPRYQDNQDILKSILPQISNKLIFPNNFDINNSKFFKDQGHLNYYGQKVFTMYFHELIKEL
ncbi:hypothetical protein [Algoriphagus sp.]|uniref:hypothetical protein n=1 Tax=Algoriphagus sp. TaxID=1872435 RepID=UPI002606E7E9|nr:hypothetical protein [Algoriphagus sp.]